MSDVQQLIDRLEDRRVCSLAHNSCYNDFRMQEAARALAAQAAEIERLKGWAEHGRQWNDLCESLGCALGQDKFDFVYERVGEAVACATAAEADAERLRAALADLVAMGEQYGWDTATTGRDLLMKAARAALEQKPRQRAACPPIQHETPLGVSESSDG